MRNIRAPTNIEPPLEFADVDSPQVLRQFTSLTVDDVVKLSQVISLVKQSDLDPMPVWLLKSCADVLAPFLTHLYNICLSAGHVPVVCCVIDFTGCQFHNEYNTNFVCLSESIVEDTVCEEGRIGC